MVAGPTLGATTAPVGTQFGPAPAGTPALGTVQTPPSSEIELAMTSLQKAYADKTVDGQPNQGSRFKVSLCLFLSNMILYGLHWADTTSYFLFTIAPFVQCCGACSQTQVHVS